MSSNPKDYMCRDCTRGVRVHDDSKMRRSELKCEVSKTWVSPFADICDKFKLRGDRGIGKKLIEKLTENEE